MPAMADANWMVYGANGYTGELIAQVAADRGMRPILAGRRADAVRAVAQRHGFEHRAFGLDDPERVARELEGVAVVVHAAGPFSATSAPMVAACLAAGAHYLDITGEIAVFEACHAQDEDARRAGVVVMPGVGFDVVPSDCLAAALARALPDADHLQLAISGGAPSVGTAKTMVEGLPQGGAVRRNGVIERVPAAYKSMDVPFRDKTRSAVTIPWGDVSTAYYSTGIPNIEVYMAMPRRMIEATRMARPLMGLLGLGPVQSLIKRGIERNQRGPSATARAAARQQLWGRVTNAAGASVEGTLETPEGYTLTSLTAVEAAARVLAGDVQPGAKTPAMAFGPDFITEIDGCSMQIGELGR